MAKDLVIILAGGIGRRLLLLSECRAKPAVPFGGIYRIIDFALSNCVNSGLRQVFVLSQYEPRSLWRHLDFGNPWGLNGLGSEIVILQPYIGNVENKWYEGNADAVRRNLHFIEERGPEAVLVLGGDHVYTMDYRPLLDFHRQKNADLTIAVTKVKAEETAKFGTCTLDGDKRIIEFEEKSESAKSNLASMGIYVFSRKSLFDSLTRDAGHQELAHDFGRDVVPRMIRRDRVYGYEFRGYWRDVGTIATYFESNLMLARPRPFIDLSDTDWPILTNFEDHPPARTVDGCKVMDSLVCDGCVIEGTVESSIVSPGATVERDAVVRNSIIMAGCTIGEGAKINLSVVDKDTMIGEQAKIGYGVDFSPNQDHPAIMDKGITLIGKGSFIPPDSVIGRNCLVRVTQNAAEPLRLRSGQSLC
jgi:glucose-1-phosphate adenylyltransferase